VTKKICRWRFEKMIWALGKLPVVLKGGEKIWEKRSAILATEVQFIGTAQLCIRKKVDTNRGHRWGGMAPMTMGNKKRGGGEPLIR